MMKITLASSSPRRKALLEQLGVTFAAISPEVDENALAQGLSPENMVEELARAKARTASELADDGVIIAADTTVAIDGKILGKPENAADAFDTLRLLSGRTHAVFTGVCVIIKDGATTRSRVFRAETAVTIRPLSDTEINAYIKTNEPFDKAGSYAAQGFGALLIEKINGDFYNVVGLPISKLYEELKNLGIDLIA